MHTATTQAEARARWAEALRSGDFTQTTGSLRTSNGFCCLGVACELFIEAFPDELLDRGPTARGYVDPDEGYENSALPRRVQLWLGIDASGTYRGDHNLANDNDNGMSFHQIADRIEAADWPTSWS